jgi:hypothetical protein
LIDLISAIGYNFHIANYKSNHELDKEAKWRTQKRAARFAKPSLGCMSM